MLVQKRTKILYVQKLFLVIIVIMPLNTIGKRYKWPHDSKEKNE